MASLKNVRHERFVQGLLEGKTALDAYEAAGFARDDGNAARLRRSPAVQERLAELQTEIAAKVPVTIESLITELEQARGQATGKNQFAAAIKAILGKAQLSGLLVEKKQVEISGAGSFDSIEEYAAEHARFFSAELGYTHSVTEADCEYIAKVYAEAIETMTRTIQEAEEKLREEIVARPLGSVQYRPPQALPSPLNGKQTEY